MPIEGDYFNHDKMEELFFAKTNASGIIPSKRFEDAGYDFYPNFEDQSITIRPGEIALIPTGIATAFPPSYALIVKERGSTGSLGFAVRMGVVDSGYRGEIVIGINNTSNKIQEITKLTNTVEITEDRILYPYSKAIAQGIFVCLLPLSPKETSYEALQEIKSQRMFGKLGESEK